jgi:hypothetical protein
VNPLIGQALIGTTLFGFVATVVGTYRTIRYAPPLERTRWIPALVVFLATLLGCPLIMGLVWAMPRVTATIGATIVYGWLAAGTVASGFLGLRLARQYPPRTAP